MNICTPKEVLERLGSDTDVQLLYVSWEHWPLPQSGQTQTQTQAQAQALKIAVLDSSFNPPTNAHYALATSPSNVCCYLSQGQYTSINDTVGNV